MHNKCVDSPDGWKKASVELPDGLHLQVSELALSLRGGKTGLLKHVWTVGACLLISMDIDMLEDIAKKLRNELESRGDPAKALETVRRLLAVKSIADEELERAANSAAKGQEGKTG